MEQILLIIVVPSFLSLWIIVVILYTPSCFRLRAMIDLIDEDGELQTDKIKWSIGYNFHTVDNWLISIPTSDKYLKYDLVTKAIKKIRLFRRIIGVLLPLLIVCGIILLGVVD